MLVGMVLALGLFAVVALVTEPNGGRSQAMSTMALAINAPNAVVMERDAQAHALEMARVEAGRLRVLQEERTLRIGILVGGLVTVALCVAGGLLIVHRPQRVVVVHRLEGSYGQHRLTQSGEIVKWEE